MDRFCSYLLMGKLSGVNVLENSILGNVKTRRPVEVTDCTMDRGSSPFKIKFQKIQTFRTSEILSLKKLNRQTVVWRDVKITATTNHLPKTGVS